MSENNQDSTTLAADQPTEQETMINMPVTIQAQYIRDVSFENPLAPFSMKAGLPMPEMDVNIGMDARQIEDEALPNTYEVALTISATATRDSETVFIAEVVYGVTVTVGEGVPQDQHHPLLLIEIPRYAFPFARQIMANVTSQGGYPPLLLNPVDFQALYVERFKDEIEKSRQNAAQSGQEN